MDYAYNIFYKQKMMTPPVIVNTTMQALLLNLLPFLRYQIAVGRPIPINRLLTFLFYKAGYPFGTIVKDQFPHSVRPNCLVNHPVSF